MKSQKWIKVTFLLTLVLILISMLFNYIVNPCKVFDNNFIQKNDIRLSLENYRIVKFYYAKKLKPNILMIGTSRIAHLNPEELNKYVVGKTYNLGLHGAGIVEQYYNIDYFIKNSNINTIVIGIDFASFTEEINEPYSDYNLKSGFNIDRFSTFYYKDYLNALVGFVPLKNSIIALGDKYYERELDTNIENGWDNRNDRYKELELEGTDAIKNRIAESLEEYSRDNYLFNSASLKNYQQINKYIEYLKKIVVLCKNNNINLKIYISPIYCKHFDLIYSKGLGKTFEHWKKEIVKFVEIYDFTGSNIVNNDLNFFLDSSHARASVGKYIFSVLYDDKTIEVPKGFGVLLNSSNVDMYIKKNHKTFDCNNKEKYNTKTNKFTSKPILIKSVNNINIVHYKQLYYALPQNLGKIDLEKDNVKDLNGVIIENSLSKLIDILTNKEKKSQEDIL